MQKFGIVSFDGNSIRSWQWQWYRSQQERQCQLKVNIMSNIYKEGHTDKRRSFKLSSARLRFVNWTLSSWPRNPQNFFSLYGVVTDIFSNKSESMTSATAFLTMSSASIKSVAMPGTPKDKKYTSLSSKLELKGLMKSETASSTRSTLHLSRLNNFSAWKSCFNILSSGVMSNTPFNL